MKEELTLARIIILSLVLSVIPWALVRVNFFKTVFVYKGVIIDALEDYPAVLVEIGEGPNITYSLENGKFELLAASELKNIIYLPTTDFEKPSSFLSCQKKELSFLKKEFSCESLVYPTALTVAVRSLNTLVSSPNLYFEERRQRKEKLWNYTSLRTQKLWGDQGEFVGSLILYDTTSESLKTNIVSYGGVEELESLERFPYLTTGIVEGPIAKIKATLTEASGRDRIENLYLVREDGIWKLLFAKSRGEVTGFNAKYAWVFKKKTL